MHPPEVVFALPSFVLLAGSVRCLDALGYIASVLMNDRALTFF
jgi:hypothetical protein